MPKELRDLSSEVAALTRRVVTAHSSPIDSPTAQKSAASTSPLRTPKEAADYLKCSLSWLAKARMRGDGPPYMQIGRMIRYSDTGLAQYARSRQRISTSE
jgi:hypothetical protein